MIISYFLVVLIFTLSTASGGLIQASTSTDLSVTETDTMIKDANNLSYASLALFMVATILLIPMATVARKKAGSDKVCDNHIKSLPTANVMPVVLVDHEPNLVRNCSSATCSRHSSNDTSDHHLSSPHECRFPLFRCDRPCSLHRIERSLLHRRLHTVLLLLPPQAVEQTRRIEFPALLCRRVSAAAFAPRRDAAHESVPGSVDISWYVGTAAAGAGPNEFAISDVSVATRC